MRHWLSASLARHSPHVIEVGEDERLLELETTSDNVGNVGQTKLVVLLEGDLLASVTLKKELFVIFHVSVTLVLELLTSDLNDKGHVEDVLQPAGRSASMTDARPTQ